MMTQTAVVKPSQSLRRAMANPRRLADRLQRANAVLEDRINRVAAQHREEVKRIIEEECAPSDPTNGSETPDA